jgi:pimeloyl-ACP methyl ester carboxylesterase
MLFLTLLTACTHLNPEVVAYDGRDVEVAVAGAGPSTVVFESGLGDDWARWDKVAYDVSQDARVFAYSRPGYGRSNDATTPRDPAQIVAELRGLLTAQGFDPPYVLVGHSFGGTYMELFARSQPSEVSALVLVDERPVGFLDACEREGLGLCGIPSDALEKQSDVVQDEYNAFPLAADEMSGAFGAYPVRVLTSTEYPGASEARMALWASMQEEIANEAVDGEQTVFEGADHYLQLHRRDEVSAAIRAVLP